MDAVSALVNNTETRAKMPSAAAAGNRIRDLCDNSLLLCVAALSMAVILCLSCLDTVPPLLYYGA